jgi:membrane protein DedA with SNARE-associated domain
MIIFLVLLGIVIALASGDATVQRLTTGAILGAIAGYFIGRQIDKSFNK